MAYEYTVNGQAVQLEQDEDLVGVRYTEPAPHSFRAAFSSKAGADFQERIEVPNEKFTLLKTPPVSPASVVQGVNAALHDDSAGITRTTPVFKLGDTHVLATDRVLLGVDDPNLPVANVLSGVNYASIKARGHGEYTVTLASDANPLAVAQQIAGRIGVAYAEPDFVNVGKPVSPGTEAKATEAASQEATWHDKQYAIPLTQADRAWGLVSGNSSIAIAVLDDGVDTRHRDLRKAIKASFDASDNDAFQEPNIWDGHGTACAGLAAAMPDDAKGMRGIGGGCSILAVRIAYSDKPRGPWTTSNSQIATAIDWAWMNGADVISNSWGGGAPSNAIVLAFRRASTSGRDGRGCAIVVAAGNSQGAVNFPANIAEVLCVGASNEKDELKTKTSSDGEDWWGSCFGPEVDVVAPGVHNYTTDITGPSGYNPGGDYTPNFNGTSSATPLVAGACALILSVKPSLRGETVHSLIMATADKVGNIPYENGRNDLFGYGRLNVFRAVQAASTA